MEDPWDYICSSSSFRFQIFKFLVSNLSSSSLLRDSCAPALFPLFSYLVSNLSSSSLLRDSCFLSYPSCFPFGFITFVFFFAEIHVSSAFPLVFLFWFQICLLLRREILASSAFPLVFLLNCKFDRCTLQIAIAGKIPFFCKMWKSQV